jgi:hypothetical protein
MGNEHSKQLITIEIDPLLATSTIGLVRGVFPSIIASLENISKESAVDGGLKFTNVEEMQEVLDEIYQKCIEKTDVREKAKEFLKEMDLDISDIKK